MDDVTLDQTLADWRVVLTADEVAKMLKVSRRTVERLRIPSVKLGRTRRYLREDVLDYLRQKVA